MRVASLGPVAIRSLRALGFAGRLSLATSLLIVAVCVTQGLILGRSLLADVEGQLIERGHSVGRYMARDAGPSVETGDVARLREHAERALLQRGVVYARFFDAHGLLLASMGAPPTNTPPPVQSGSTSQPSAPVEVDDDTWEFQTPVPATGPGSETVGTFTIGLSTAGLSATRRHAVTTTILFTLLVTILAVGATIALARHITRPLGALAAAADAIGRGDLGTTVGVRRDDEIGAVARSFDTMVGRLSAHRSALEMNLRELERANHLKSEFLATVSHELRTPLNVILGYVEMLGDGVAGDLSDDQQALLREVERYSRLQLDLITNVLDFSRLSSGRISLHVERFALPPVLGELHAVYGSRADAAGLTLDVGTDPHLPLLETDRIKVQEILRNLVDNAVKFTTAGTVSVRAVAARDPGWVLLEVADTGPGIPVADVDLVFEAFHQRGASSTRGTGGVGLGLSIVRQLAEALGGHVTLASRVGFGSTFRVAIPVRAPGVADVPDAAPAPGQSVQVVAEPQPVGAAEPAAEPIRVRARRAASS